MNKTNISSNMRRNRSQLGNQNTTPSTTQNAMLYTTMCMTQSTFQKKILNLLQQAGDKVAEAMNIIDEVGAITGINVHFERGGRSDLAERSEQDDYRHGDSRHSDVNWGNRTDALDELDERDKFDKFDEFDEIDDIDDFGEIKEVTIPELADMISGKTCFRPECTLCVLNTAFDLMGEQNLMLNLGTFHANTEEGTEGSYTDDAYYYDAKCGDAVMNQRTERTGGKDQ